MGRLRERFRAQFTPAARGWVYRSRGRGPALPVGEEDHAALVAGFDRATRWLVWLAIAASAAVWGVLDWRGLHPPEWAVMVPFVAIFCGAMWWVWRAPNRLLDGRAPLAPALTGAQAWRDNMRTLPWIVLILGALVSIGIVVRVQFEPDPWAPHQRGHYIWAAVFLACFAALAVAKRRAG